MKSLKVGRHHRWLGGVGLLALVTMVTWPWAVHAKQDLRIHVVARNLSALDTPFCGVGVGLVGDELEVDVRTDLSGVTTGTATFTPEGGPVVTLNIDRVFAFNLFSFFFGIGGLVLRESSTGNTVALWLNDRSAPAHVNVELPGGCLNTVSTFTAGVDVLSMQIIQ